MNMPSPFANPRKRSGTKLVDCGGPMLSVSQIATATGLSIAGIHGRMYRGIAGAALLLAGRTKLYDVGTERLTIKQLCERTGVADATMYNRIARGWKGKDLLTKNCDRRRRGMARSPTQHIAFKLAFAFGKNLPTTKEIMRVQPMSHTSAMRWKNAMQQAIES